MAFAEPPPAGADPPPDAYDRGESELEKLDRNTLELLAEMRVAAVGIQVVLGFLLIVPFNAGWRHATAFDRDEYFVTLVLILTAAVLLIAPVIHHRILFRRHQKAYLVEVGNRMTIVAMVFQAFGLTGILVLIAHYLFGGLAAAIGGGVALLVVCGVWFALPLARRRRLRGFQDQAPG